MSKKKKMMIGAAMTLASAGIGGITASAATISEIAQSAVPVANEYGLYPSVMIAQAILESGSGQSELASVYNNYFGIKYTYGQGVDLPTTEYIDGVAQTVTQTFQVYGSIAESFDAHAQLLVSYYPGTLQANTNSYLDATASLQGHYATDPNYANLLNSIIASYDLTAYDGGGATTLATASTSSGDGGQYTVRAGDSLWSIANANGISVADLTNLNGLSTDSILQVGQVLSLSGTSSSPAANNSVGGMASSTAYTVQSGDSLWSIAQANGMTVSQLASLNGISEDSILSIGQQISLSASVGLSVSQQSTSGGENASSYVVQAGDTLSAIANQYGVSVEEIASANGLSDANVLAVGQVLNI
ncbi:MAG: LysM peptidoglycan-binding domain-containing protein [Streptococcaceae bacterium]|jgi:LysM repeat protein|nr:LysM peptidoglycan-binding domain-containing protein [Streptococcaceae bacterium]